MSNDPSPLQYMGTQSQETVNMAAAMALAAERAAAKAIDADRDASAVGSKIGEAANWALDKAKGTLQSAAGQVRERATTAVTTYTKEDPVRALLIAAGTGALLMAVVAVMARSGVRTIKRSVQR